MVLGNREHWTQYTSYSCQHGAAQQQQDDLQTQLVPDAEGQVWRGTTGKSREEATMGVWRTWEDGLKNRSDRAKAV